MTDELDSQVDTSSVELTFPHIPILPPFFGISSHPASLSMTKGSTASSNDAALSESWTTLSDVDCSLDDDLHSETTDAASLVDNTSPDDVHSLDDRTSDGSSQDTQSEKDEPEELSSHDTLFESARTLKAENREAEKDSRLRASLLLRPHESQQETNFFEARMILRTFTDNEASEILQQTWENGSDRQLFGSIGMSMSPNGLRLDRPFRLWYIGKSTARARILAKIRDVLAVTSGPSLSRRPESSPSSPDRIPTQTQIIVDDCTTVASIKHDQAPDQIFLSFKNGTLYSSRWNDSGFEVTSASEWVSPDLAIFFVGRDDHSLLQQRHQLADAFVSRHQIPALIVSESTSWTSSPNELSLHPCSLHLRVELNKPCTGQTNVLRRLPIDLETFEVMDSGQLSKHFECLRRSLISAKGINTHHYPSAPSCASHNKSSMGNQEIGRNVVSKPNNAPFWCHHHITQRTFVMFTIGLIALVIAVVYIAPLAMWLSVLSGRGNVYELTFPTPWSLQPSSTPTFPEKTSSLIQTASGVIVPSSRADSKSLATVDTPSDLAHLISDKSLHATNRSEDFQVHSIGDCHIIVKTPQGLKIKNKSAPFDVLVFRGDQVLNSALSKLFDGVYTIRVDREEAYGLVNVVIKRHKSSIREKHQIDLGAQWLKMAGWKKAAQIASEQVREDLEAVQVALAAVYEQLCEDLQCRTKDISKRAALHAQKFSRQSRVFIDHTTSRLWARSADLREVVFHEGQAAYTQLGKRADLALHALSIYAHAAHEGGRTIIEEIIDSANRGAVHIQESVSRIGLGEVLNLLQEYRRSEALARAQERAQQLARDAAQSWRKRRTLTKFSEVRSGRRNKSSNR